MRRSPFRHMMLGACLVAPFLLAGCSGGDEGVPQNFPPLRYTYLAPISLNVGQIVTVVQYAPTADGTSMDANSPEMPLDAVRQMIQDRLVAGGGGGIATVTINSASLTRVTDTVVANISIHLAVRSADGRSSGYTDASVTRSATTPEDTSESAMRAFLYQMTQQAVSAENVELEFQIRKNLGSWLIGGGSSAVGGPAAPTPVEAQPLGMPGAPAPLISAPDTGAPIPLGTPVPLGSPAPMSPPMPQLVAPAAPSAPAMAPMTMPMPAAAAAPAVPDVEMPSGSLGMPQGNPVPPDATLAPPPTSPVPLAPAATATPAPTYQLVPGSVSAPVPAASPAAAPAPAAPSSSGALPPLPPGITP